MNLGFRPLRYYLTSNKKKNFKPFDNKRHTTQHQHATDVAILSTSLWFLLYFNSKLVCVVATIKILVMYATLRIQLI